MSSQCSNPFLKPGWDDYESAFTSAWDATPVEDVLRELEAGAEGLSDTESGRRLARYGPNRFERAPPASAWRVLIRQLRDVVAALLAVAAVVALLT